MSAALAKQRIAESGNPEAWVRHRRWFAMTELSTHDGVLSDLAAVAGTVKTEKPR